jgi:hypothetical protein
MHNSDLNGPEGIFKIISMAQSNDNPFAILGVAPGATEQEIRKTYRYLVVLSSGDRALVQSSFLTLSNPCTKSERIINNNTNLSCFLLIDISSINRYSSSQPQSS